VGVENIIIRSGVADDLPTSCDFQLDKASYRADSSPIRPFATDRDRSFHVGYSQGMR